MEKMLLLTGCLFLVLALAGCCSVMAALKTLAAVKPRFLRLTLPEVIYAVPGIESNIYFENVIDSANFHAYAVEVKCQRGTHGNLRWFWTPGKEDAGKEFDLELRLFNDYGKIISASCKVVVASEPADFKRKFTLSLLAASSVNSGYPEHLLKLMREEGFENYTPVGKHSGRGEKPVPGAIAHDGYGGFSWGCFLERWLYTQDELPQAQNEAEREQMIAFGVRNLPQSEAYRMRSPLLKLVDGQKVLDIPGWLQEINGGKAPDFIVIQLGGNDMFSALEEDRESQVARTMQHARRLLAELRKHAPDAVIGVATGLCGCDQDGFGANYKSSQSRYQYRRNIQSYNLAITDLVRELADPRMSVIPLNQCIDPKFGYLQDDVPIHARHPQKISRDCNGLHASVYGGYQIGDAIYCWLRKQLEK